MRAPAPLLGATLLLGGGLAWADTDPARPCASYAGLPTEGEKSGMVWIAGGSFTMGSDAFRPEEAPEREVRVKGFWIDRHEVTNAQFRRFVEATGYVTLAERGLDPAAHPGLPPQLLAPGSMVFSPPERLADQADVTRWWRYVAGADWRHPTGPGSSSVAEDHRPVIHVAFEDAAAYADWLDHDLPTEAEWEFAARGGLEGAGYVWGDQYYDPAAGWRANTWQGSFPARNEELDGYFGTAPVGCFEPNGYGLFDMAGNVWEYTLDWYLPGHAGGSEDDPVGPPEAWAAQFGGPAGPMRVIKGGSFLCAPDFCARYRPAARQHQELGLGASHLGFRTVLRAAEPS